METEEKNKLEKTSIEGLKREIDENDLLIGQYLKNAQKMKFLVLVTAVLSLLFFLSKNYMFGGAMLLLAFLCFRNYNRLIGMAEIHNSISKFLKYMLNREVTGEKGLPGFLA